VTVLRWAAGIGAGGFIVILLVFWVTQRRLTYYPSEDVGEPAAVGLPRAEPVTFPTEDGLRLGGWFVPPSTSPTGDVIVVFNGNAGNRSYRADLARGFAARGIATLLFDYRGYGENPGTPSEEGLAKDARAARAYLDGRGDVAPGRVTYFGESLGSGVAVRLTATHRPRALILRSPFTSLADAARHHFPYLPVGLLLRDRYRSIDTIASIGCPLLVVSAAHDSIVPADQSRRLYAAAREPKSLLVIENADHNDEALVAGPRVFDAVVELLSGLK
jgi:fermentation-respiration switch protein FrsA (DUF1100 family)